MTVFGQKESINVSHVIHCISFGDVYPSMVNPLDGTPKVLTNTTGFFQYHIKVVPTLYEPWFGESLLTNQFSYTELFRTTHEVCASPFSHGCCYARIRPGVVPIPLRLLCSPTL